MVAAIIGIMATIIGGLWFFGRRVEKRIEKTEQSLKADIERNTEKLTEAQRADKAELKADIADLKNLPKLQRADKAELKADIADLRTELKADKAELKADMERNIDKLIEAQRADKAELKADIADLRTELKADIDRNNSLIIQYIAGNKPTDSPQQPPVKAVKRTAEQPTNNKGTAQQPRRRQSA